MSEVEKRYTYQHEYIGYDDQDEVDRYRTLEDLCDTILENIYDPHLFTLAESGELNEGEIKQLLIHLVDEVFRIPHIHFEGEWHPLYKQKTQAFKDVDELYKAFSKCKCFKETIKGLESEQSENIHRRELVAKFLEENGMTYNEAINAIEELQDREREKKVKS